MGKTKKHQPVKLIAGFIFKETPVFEKAKLDLKRHFGGFDLESGILSFYHTDYYQEEMGEGLKRVFVSFKRLIYPLDLPQIKVLTNKIEDKFSREGKRGVNIDPGYLDLAKLVLASTKDFNHRLYLGKGIFGEITLFYTEKTFKPREWTYPDYRTPECIALFNEIRTLYADQINNRRRYSNK